MMQLVVGWTCVGVFIATAIITLLALVGIIKLADEKYLNRLITVLVIEIVVVGVGAWRGMIESPSTVESRVKEVGRELGEDEGRRAAVAELTPEFERLRGLVVQKEKIIARYGLQELGAAEIEVLQKPVEIDQNVIERVLAGTAPTR